MELFVCLDVNLKKFLNPDRTNIIFRTLFGVGVTGINGTGAHVGVEAVVESAAREALICETCRVSLYDVNDPLVWEAKEYCSIKCLSKILSHSSVIFLFLILLIRL